VEVSYVGLFVDFLGHLEGGLFFHFAHFFSAGLLVTHVEQASPAALAGVRTGDIVVAAAAPESKMLRASSTEMNFFITLLREANPVLLRLRRHDVEFTVSVHKVFVLV
jgi:S1-C subfamily serine protease